MPKPAVFPGQSTTAGEGVLIAVAAVDRGWDSHTRIDDDGILRLVAAIDNDPREIADARLDYRRSPR